MAQMREQGNQLVTEHVKTEAKIEQLEELMKDGVKKTPKKGES